LRVRYASVSPNRLNITTVRIVIFFNYYSEIAVF
jgi:hypothetical protein